MFTYLLFHYHDDYIELLNKEEIMRKLNESEKQILALKQERRIKKGISSSLSVSFIEYRKPTHKTTLCILANSSNPFLDEVVLGEAVLKDNDIDNQPVGAVISFIKALNSI